MSDGSVRIGKGGVQTRYKKNNSKKNDIKLSLLLSLLICQSVRRCECERENDQRISLGENGNIVDKWEKKVGMDVSQSNAGRRKSWKSKDRKSEVERIIQEDKDQTERGGKKEANEWRADGVY